MTQWYTKSLRYTSGASFNTVKWENTPVTPNRVYVNLSSGGQGSAFNVYLYTNVNPTTNEVDGKWYESNINASWSECSTAPFTISGNNITGITQGWSSVYQVGVFFIAE